MDVALDAKQLLLAGVAGAAVVGFGGLYALFLAWFRLHHRQRDRNFAIFFYVALVTSFVLLAYALRLDALWQGFIAFLLLGYLIAPQWIWRLTEATHGKTVPHKCNDKEIYP